MKVHRFNGFSNVVERSVQLPEDIYLLMQFFFILFSLSGYVVVETCIFLFDLKRFLNEIVTD